MQNRRVYGRDTPDLKRGVGPVPGRPAGPSPVVARAPALTHFLTITHVTQHTPE